MSKLYQIYEDDLSEIEKIIPELGDHLGRHLTPRMRTQLRRVKDILSNVRWNYGPHDDVEIIPEDGE